MKKYILILLLASAFMACEKTVIVGGTVVDVQTGDSIVGIEMGLYASKTGKGYEMPKWDELELIASGTTNSEGVFSVEIDDDIDVSSYTFCYPLPPLDTLSVNALYTANGGQNLCSISYGRFTLDRSSNIKVRLKNFTQEKIEMQCDIGSILFEDGFYVISLYYSRLLAGKKHQFDFYELVSSNNDNQEPELVYLGSATRFIKTQLPEDSSFVDWIMPLQEIEIDYNTLEK